MNTIVVKQAYLHVMPKLSVSVKTSLSNPLHCLEIFPTSSLPSAERTWQKSKLKTQKKIQNVKLLVTKDNIFV